MVKKRRWFFGKPPKKKKSIWKKPEKKKSADYRTRYNVYFYDQRGRARKIKTFRDKKEAQSWVSNKKAANPYADYKIISDIKKKGW